MTRVILAGLVWLIATSAFAQTSAPVRYGTLATCTYVGELWMDTSGTPTLKKCTGTGSPGVWIAVEGAGGGGSTSWGQIGGTLSNQADLNTALAGKAPTAHTHAISDVTSLQSALDAKAATGHTHSGLAPAGGTTGQVLKKSSALNFDYAWATDESGSGGTAWGDVTGTLSQQTDLQTALDGKASSSHAHAQSDVTNLTTDLAGKANTSHTHVDADIPNTITIDAAAALAANPTDCAATQFATTIAANGNLTCAALVDADVPNTITVNLAGTATALAANPTDCTSGQFATAIDASGNLTCGTPAGGGGGATYVRLTGDVTNATTSLANVTGLSFAVTAGTRYDIECAINYTVNATTTGSLWTFTGPAATLSGGLVVSGNTTTTPFTTIINANDSGAVTTATPQATPNVQTAHFTHNYVPSASGTWQLRFRSEIAVANAVIAKAGSFCKYGTY